MSNRQRYYMMWLLCLLCLLCILTACEPTPEERSITTAPPRTQSPQSQSQSPPSMNDESDCTYFVAPDGSDSAPGTRDQPWETIQQAADSAQPGDVICLRGGTYPTPEGVSITSSGTAEAPITFAAYPGESPILDGQNEAGDLINLARDVAFVRVSGLMLQNFRIWGITVAGGNHDIVLEHLDIGGGEASIHFTIGNSGEEPEEGPVWGITVTDSFIHDPIYTAVDCTPGPCDAMTFSRLEITGAGMSTGEASFGADALAIEQGQPIIVEDCVIHDNGGDGIDLNSRDTQGNVEGVIVRRNLVYNNRLQAIKLWSGGRMENNVVWGQGINPVMIGVYPGDFEVVNNTIAYNMWDPSFTGRDYAFVAAWPETGASAAIKLVMVGNIFAFNTGPDIDGGPTGLYFGEGVEVVQEGANVFFSREECEIEANNLPGRSDPCISAAEITDGRWSEAVGGSGSIYADPLFVGGWPDVDLQLSDSSPAIDLGTFDIAPADDLLGESRDESPDSGAYEH